MIGLILFVLVFALLLGGLQIIFKKFFGVELTSRSNYNNAVRMGHMRNGLNHQKIQSTDPATVQLAILKLKKKGYAITSDNIVEELTGMEYRMPADRALNEIKERLATVEKLTETKYKIHTNRELDEMKEGFATAMLKMKEQANTLENMPKPLVDTDREKNIE